MPEATTTKVATKDLRTPIDLALVKPIIEAKVKAADAKAAKTYTSSPSILAASIADEAQAQGLVKTREEWRFVYYTMKEQIVPALFPKVAPAAKAA